MQSFLGFRRAIWIAAIASLVSIIALAAIQSRHSEDAAVLEPMERGTADALVTELARCRTIVPDDIAALESCRRIWAENCKNFFLSTKSPSPLSEKSAGSVKKGDRIPSLGHDLGRAN